MRHEHITNKKLVIWGPSILKILFSIWTPLDLSLKKQIGPMGLRKIKLCGDLISAHQFFCTKKYNYTRTQGSNHVQG